MYNIMTPFNKIKLKYLIQVWDDVMKVIRNVKNVNAEKILWWNIVPYVTLSHHFREPPPPPPVASFLKDPLSLCETITRINWKH